MRSICAADNLVELELAGCVVAGVAGARLFTSRCWATFTGGA
jgi:hypothetical protein